MIKSNHHFHWNHLTLNLQAELSYYRKWQIKKVPYHVLWVSKLPHIKNIWKANTKTDTCRLISNEKFLPLDTQNDMHKLFFSRMQQNANRYTLFPNTSSSLSLSLFWIPICRWTKSFVKNVLILRLGSAN